MKSEEMKASSTHTNQHEPNESYVSIHTSWLSHVIPSLSPCTHYISTIPWPRPSHSPSTSTHGSSLHPPIAFSSRAYAVVVDADATVGPTDDGEVDDEREDDSRVASARLNDLACNCIHRSIEMGGQSVTSS